jgi:hypothetical protein
LARTARYVIEHELGGGADEEQFVHVTFSWDFDDCPVPRPLVRRPLCREYGGASAERRALLIFERL